MNSVQENILARFNNNPPGFVSTNESSHSPKNMPTYFVVAPDGASNGTELKSQGIVNG